MMVPTQNSVDGFIYLEYAVIEKEDPRFLDKPPALKGTGGGDRCL
jgi:hypothetical protein